CGCSRSCPIRRWLRPRLARCPLAVALALVAVGYVVYIRDCWKRNERVMADALAPFAAAQPGRTLLPLLADRSTPYSHLPFLSHVVSYAAAERRLVDLGNYEAGQTYFPVTFRPGLRRPSAFDIATKPPTTEGTAYNAD